MVVIMQASELVPPTSLQAGASDQEVDPVGRQFPFTAAYIHGRPAE